MAYFAQINADSIVDQVVRVANSVIIDNDGKESEQLGIEFCQSLYGKDTTWLQTSYNTTIRRNYAGIGYSYDADRDAFIPPQPFPNWLLDEDTYLWQPPIPMPEDGQQYRWDEDAGDWVLI